VIAKKCKQRVDFLHLSGIFVFRLLLHLSYSICPTKSKNLPISFGYLLWIFSGFGGDILSEVSQ
jgi:hypothetical protein